MEDEILFVQDLIDTEKELEKAISLFESSVKLWCKDGEDLEKYYSAIKAMQDAVTWLETYRQEVDVYTGKTLKSN